MAAVSHTIVPMNYVVVWEWENRPTWWRPYSPEVTQLLERAHNKKLNRIYLKDADPDYADYYINMTSFEQVCEPSGQTYSVRREFYAHTTPAGRGSKWEWLTGDLSNPKAAGDDANWHMYDMEVQAIIEESWTRGEQTVDIGKHFPGCAYIINFCNMTQVRSTTGQVRRVRRLPQPAYPVVRLTQAEIAAMMHRKEIRIKDRADEVERRKRLSKKNGNKSKKRAVKHLMNQLFHHGVKEQKASRADRTTSPTAKPLLGSTNTLPVSNNEGSRKALNVRSTIENLRTNLDQRMIGHPSAMSDCGYPIIIGRRGHQYRPNPQRIHPRGTTSTLGYSSGSPKSDQRYRRFQDYSSFSSFSDTSSIVRRPSMDTISTYLSNGQRSGYDSSSKSLYHGSQELLDMCGNDYDYDEDSVFTDDDVSLNFRRNSGSKLRLKYGTLQYHQHRKSSYESMSVANFGRNRDAYNVPMNQLSAKNRVFSDPMINAGGHSHFNQDDLYCNMISLNQQDVGRSMERISSALSQHSLSASPVDLAPKATCHRYETVKDDLYCNLNGIQNISQSQQSLNSPSRGATFYDYPLSNTPQSNTSSPSKTGKRPVPTPRSIVNFNQKSIKARLFPDSERIADLEKLIMRYSQSLVDSFEPDDYCPLCAGHLADPDKTSTVNDDLERNANSVVRLSSCQHKVHVSCLMKMTLQRTENDVSHIKCPTCGTVYGQIRGNMPMLGATMTYRIVAKGLPGHEDYHTIQITYNFPEAGGIQQQDHPNPGKPFFVIGFPKIAFLPDTEKGRRVLRLLENAFHARLTFTVDGTGQLVWNKNELPHKTEFGPPRTTTEPSEHCYPDPNYLDDIITSLARLGITDEASV